MKGAAARVKCCQNLFIIVDQSSGNVCYKKQAVGVCLIYLNGDAAVHVYLSVVMDAVI